MAASPVTLEDILKQYREDARSNRQMGDKFERLMCRFFELDPIYAEHFSNVWMWSEWPGRGNMGDTGIDIVAEERATGNFCAIQCKFYLPEHTISKGDIDSFLAAAGKDPFTSSIIVSTTNLWGKNAEDALNQTKKVIRLNLGELESSPIDWSKYDVKQLHKLIRAEKKKIRPHQQAALNDVTSKLAKAERGKLIMACGTGKTFTALRIAEAIAPKGVVLFLVPSLSLLAQTLREWTSEAEVTLHSMAVCSDSNIGTHRKSTGEDTGDITIHDLAFPATTNAKQLNQQFDLLKAKAKKEKRPGMTVVFSTYQSNDAVSKAQKAGLPDFDLIICDEAHRTTGVTLSGEDESHFVKVHDADFIVGRKRLYMTATPRIYGDGAKTKAKDAAAELASMDDPRLFGHELHRLGFGEAVVKGLLADYKVLVLAVDEKYVSKTFQKQLAEKDSELNLDDAVKITGCWNGLAKKLESSVKSSTDLQGDGEPMRRAVAFSRSIKDSKAFVERFHEIVAAYKTEHPDETDLLDIEADHVDGTYDALRRGERLNWLKAKSPDNTCRILSNARCLSEGVDVPALDAVLFLNPRNSVIDVVQSVGRVMRRAEGKRFGYIVLPIGIPADKTPEEALKDNEKYKVVWQVLQALRAHDDRFNATINQIELNEKRPSNVQVIGVGGGGPSDGESSSSGDSKPKVRNVQGVFAFPHLEEWKDAIYAKMVLKCGDRAYWETWAKDIARIAEQHITRIKALLDDKKSKNAKAFEVFLAGLQTNLNPSVTRDDAIEMLAQHLITKPVFDALFANYAFTQHNPVSQSMQAMLDLLHEQSIDRDAGTLEKFYASVRDRAKGLDNAAARQKVVIELYDEFFRTAFPRMAERLGIVYTPVEVVDFIIRSVEDVLRDEFQSGLGEKDVHIIDPFTGTGTFIVRLLQSGLIPPDKLAHKYKHELHANEIVLLAYYIAAINIEETYHGLQAAKSKADYVPFDGICLTDTFQLYESKQLQIEGTFPENSKRVKRQKASAIRVVISNPPYSVGQGDANNNNQNLKYAALDARIGETYAAKSTATNKNSLYNSYIRAIRWASDRIEERGVVCFVTNGYFIDGNSMDGLRACIPTEFHSVYVFNLRGNARLSGEARRAESGNVFGAGTRDPIAITLLVKNPAKKETCNLRYHDIGDYLDKTEKLAIIKELSSVSGIEAAQKWSKLTPNKQNDWINVRDPAFIKFVPLGEKATERSVVIFDDHTSGLQTNRDDWVYNFSSAVVLRNAKTMTAVYNEHVIRFKELYGSKSTKERLEFANGFVDNDSKKIKWSSSLIGSLIRGEKAIFNSGTRVAYYRPFMKCLLYFDGILNQRQYQMPRVFPTATMENKVICTTGAGNRDAFSVLISDITPDLHMSDKSGASQCFPLYLYEKVDDASGTLFKSKETTDGYHRRDAITDSILKVFRDAYGPKVTKEDIFYYVYGILHSPEYRTRFAADLKKMLPRIPLTKETKDFKAFSQAGRDLAHWHLNYETVEPFQGIVEHTTHFNFDPEELFRVEKMKFNRGNKVIDKTTIIYNSKVTLSKIPLEAYDYVVNGKPAIEWIMDRYQVTTDKDSGIKNDPNDWSKEHNDPRYIIDLVKRIVTVSLETMKIVKKLPALNERI
jgi:predicted helicase